MEFNEWKSDIHVVESNLRTYLGTYIHGILNSLFTNMSAFVPGRLDEAPTHPCEGTFVPGGGSNRYKCPHLTRGKKYPVQMKNQARGKCSIL
jgi:hypothetical protein